MIDEPRIDFRPYEDAEVLAKAAGATHTVYTEDRTFYLRRGGHEGWVEVARLDVTASPVGPIDFSLHGKGWPVDTGRKEAKPIGYRGQRCRLQ